MYDDTSFVTGFRGIAGNNGPHQYRGLVSALNINHIRRILFCLWVIPPLLQDESFGNTVDDTGDERAGSLL